MFIIFAAMPELLRSAKLAVDKGLTQGYDESYVKKLSDYIIPALVEALHKVIPTMFTAFVIIFSKNAILMIFLFVGLL